MSHDMLMEIHRTECLWSVHGYFFPRNAHVVSLNRLPVSCVRPVHGIPVDFSLVVRRLSVGCSWPPAGSRLSAPSCTSTIFGLSTGCPRSPQAARGFPWAASPCSAREGPWGARGVPVGGPWGARGLPKSYPWPVHGLLMRCPWAAREPSMGSPWATCGLPGDCLWATHGLYIGCPRTVQLSMGCPSATRGYPWVPVGCSWVVRGLSSVCSRAARRVSMGCPWAAHGVLANRPWAACRLPVGCPCAARGLSSF